MDQKMMAYVLHDIGDLRYEETVKPCPHTGEVLLRVKATGICGSDIPRIYQTGAYHHPLIPGHEFSGEVVQLGERVDRRWEGKRAGVFPLIPCGICSSCKKKQYEMCRQYDYLGSRTDGGFAEYVRVPEWNLIELPEQVTYEQAAMLEPMAVAVHAIRRSGLGVGEKDKNPGPERTIAVCGLGTIGLLIVMFLKNMGYQRIYTIGNKDFQRETLKKLGMEPGNFCDTRIGAVENWLADRTNGEGVDCFFECVGKNEILMQGINSTAPGGMLLLVGNPATDMTLKKAVYWKLLRRQVTVRGTWNSSFTHEETDDWHYVLNCLQGGNIHPENIITHRISFEDLCEGFKIMRYKIKNHIKIMGFLSDLI